MSIGYVTLEEANTYISTYYTSSDTVRTRWEGLADGDKTVFLLRSFEAIESLPIKGTKTVFEQTTQFPRYPELAVADVVKYAQADNAAYLADTESAGEDAFYEKLAKHGVSEFKVGDTSEKLTGTQSSTYKCGALVSSRAARLLQRYLTGGYSVCRGRCSY